MNEYKHIYAYRACVIYICAMLIDLYLWMIRKKNVR